jgi:hypothetical protein
MDTSDITHLIHTAFMAVSADMNRFENESPVSPVSQAEWNIRYGAHLALNSAATIYSQLRENERHAAAQIDIAEAAMESVVTHDGSTPAEIELNGVRYARIPF